MDSKALSCGSNWCDLSGSDSDSDRIQAYLGYGSRAPPRAHQAPPRAHRAPPRAHRAPLRAHRALLRPQRAPLRPQRAPLRSQRAQDSATSATSTTSTAARADTSDVTDTSDVALADTDTSTVAIAIDKTLPASHVFCDNQSVVVQLLQRDLSPHSHHICTNLGNTSNLGDTSNVALTGVTPADTDVVVTPVGASAVALAIGATHTSTALNDVAVALLPLAYGVRVHVTAEELISAEVAVAPANTSTLESPSPGEINNMPSAGEHTTPPALMLLKQLTPADTGVAAAPVGASTVAFTTVAQADVAAALAGASAVARTIVATPPADLVFLDNQSVIVTLTDTSDA